MIRLGLKDCHKVTIFWCEKDIHALKITEKGRMWVYSPPHLEINRYLCSRF